MSDPQGSAELTAALERFSALSRREQFAAYEAMREHLAELAPETSRDRELRERAESLEAMATVARELGLPEGKAPTAKQFNAEAPRLAPEWDSSRVQRRWGRWRFAKEAYEGRVQRLPSFHIDAMRRARGARFSKEDCLDALRQWLASDPRRTTGEEYTRWRDEVHSRLPSDERPFPSQPTINLRLRIGLPAALRVARGEIELAAAQRSAEKVRPDDLTWTRTEHTLVGFEWIARHAGITRKEVGRHANTRRDFPRPAARLSRRRVWLREDIETYYRGEAVPERPANWLQHLYLSAPEAAEMIGRDPGTLTLNIPTLPQAAGRASGHYFFLRSEVEQWVRDNPEYVGRPRAGKKRTSA